jgi:hypothetical protein
LEIAGGMRRSFVQVRTAAQNHWIGERMFDWCGVPVTHLRPTLFAEWLLFLFSLKSIVENDTLALPYVVREGLDRSLHEETGTVVAAILAEPAAHAADQNRLRETINSEQFFLVPEVDTNSWHGHPKRSRSAAFLTQRRS